MATSIAVNWNTDINFWDLNPSVKIIKEFGELYASDKSKKKEKSSQLMWALALLLDPNEKNPYKNISYDDKKFIIATDFLKDKKFNWEDRDIITLIDVYLNYCLTVAEKELVRFEEKLAQRGDFLAKTRYTLDSYDDRGKIEKGTADQLDKMMINTGKLYDQLEEIKNKIKAEQAKGSLRGGEAESASEEGIL